MILYVLIIGLCLGASPYILDILFFLVTRVKLTRSIYVQALIAYLIYVIPMTLVLFAFGMRLMDRHEAQVFNWILIGTHFLSTGAKFLFWRLRSPMFPSMTLAKVTALAAAHLVLFGSPLLLANDLFRGMDPKVAAEMDNYSWAKICQASLIYKVHVGTLPKGSLNQLITNQSDEKTWRGPYLEKSDLDEFNQKYTWRITESYLETTDASGVTRKCPK